jgi:ubiquinone/menaquinone biosynthesis C-methylase UbiE
LPPQTDQPTKLEADKREIQKQWDANPCAAETVSDHEAESLDYYRAIRAFRFRVYAPWIESVIRFAEWHGKDVLEIGAGLGSDHFQFAANGNRMTALDLSREHLRHTAKHLQLEGLSTVPVYGDAESMPFDDATFDLVYAFGVLHHTPHPELAITEIRRVLRPGGTAIISVYHRDSWFFWLNTLLVQGVLKLGIVRKGWRGLLSDIEYRSDPNGARPLVKLYSRGRCRQLVAGFRDVVVQAAGVDFHHFWRFSWLLKGRSRDDLEKRFGNRGWYLLVTARK